MSLLIGAIWCGGYHEVLTQTTSSPTLLLVAEQTPAPSPF